MPHEVERQSVEEMLAERKALLQRMEAAKPFPGREAFIREVRTGIDRLERRIHGENLEGGPAEGNGGGEA